MISIPASDLRTSTVSRLDALMEGGYVQTAKLARSGAYVILAVPRLTERGRRTVGQWPEDGYGALVGADREIVVAARSRGE